MDTEEKIARLEEKVSVWMETTTEYRRTLCSKIDKINDRLVLLPCDASFEQKKGMRADIGWLQKILWTALIVGIPAMLTLWGNVKSIENTVLRDTEVIKKIQETTHEHHGAIEDHHNKNV